MIKLEHVVLLDSAKLEDETLSRKPCTISCNGEFMIDNEPCTSCDVYHKIKNKEEKK